MPPLFTPLDYATLVCLWRYAATFELLLRHAAAIACHEMVASVGDVASYAVVHGAAPRYGELLHYVYAVTSLLPPLLIFAFAAYCHASERALRHICY